MTDVQSALLASPTLTSAGRFETVFADGRSGESGEFLVRDATTWLVQLGGGTTIVCAPHGSSTLHRGGREDHGPSMAMQHRPPWSLICPSQALIFGRRGDDWDTRFETHGTRAIGTMTRTDGAEGTGRVTADLDLGVLLEISSPAWTQRLVEVRAGLSEAEIERLDAAVAGVPAWSR